VIVATVHRPAGHERVEHGFLDALDDGLVQRVELAPRAELDARQPAGVAVLTG
jgi:hypothetical protein